VNNQEIYNKMLYFAYCFRFDKENNIKDCKTHEEFQTFIKESDRHMGDCTKDCCPCSRCILHDLEIVAQNLTDSLISNNSIGWCGKNCFTECEGSEKEKGESKSCT